MPYEEATPQDPPIPCGALQECVGGSSAAFELRAAAAAFGVAPRAVPDIQAELRARGPLEVAFQVFDDFMNYESGVYKRTPSAQVGLSVLLHYYYYYYY